METNQLKVWSALLLVVALIVLPLTAVAQDDLTQTFTTFDGMFTFNYPTDWVAEDFWGTVIVANSQAAMDAFLAGTGYGDGQVVAVVQTPAALAEELGGFDDLNEAEVLNAYLAGTGIEGDAQQETIGGRSVAFLMAEEAGEAAVVYAINFEAGGFAVVVQLSLAEEAATFVVTTQAIIASMVAQDLVQDMVPDDPDVPPGDDLGDGPADVAGDDRVVWREKVEIAEAGKLVVGPDDTIYVLDLIAGLHWFDADGKHMGMISPVDARVDLVAFDVTADGELWGVDYAGTIIQFDMAGATVTSIPLPDGVEAALFGVDLAVGPEGNLYLLNPRDDGMQQIGEVLVFSPEGEHLTTFEVGTDEVLYLALLAFGPDDHLYVGERYGEHGIKVFDTGGELLRDNIGVVELITISALAVDDEGTIYASLPDSPIFHFANDGAALGEFGEALRYQNGFDAGADVIPLPAEGLFYDIRGLGVLSNGDVVVIDASPDWAQLVRFSFAQ